MEIGSDGRVLELIGAAVLAGAYRSLAREIPEAERGLIKMADKWHDRTAILAADILTEAGFDLASVPVHARER